MNYFNFKSSGFMTKKNAKCYKKILIHSKIHNPIIDIILCCGISGSSCLWEFDRKINLLQVSEPLHIFTDEYYLSVQACSQTVQQWKCHYHKSYDQITV